MNKKVKSLIASLVVLGVLIGVAVYFQKNPPKKEEKQQVEQTKSYDVLKVKREDVKKITVNSEKNSYSFVPKDKEFVIEGKNYSLDKVLVDSFINNVISINSEKLVEENPKDLAKYGLNDTKEYLDIHLKNGEVKTVLVGSKTLSASTNYVMVKGENKIYTAWTNISDGLKNEIAYYRDKSLPAVDLNNLTYFRLARQGKKEIEFMNNEKRTEAQKQYNLSSFTMLKPYGDGYRDASLDKMQELLKTIGTYKISGFEAEDQNDLKKFGLDKPVMELEMKDNAEGLIRLHFGKDKDESHIYFTVDGKQGVYSMEKSNLESLEAMDPLDITTKLVFIANIDNVKDVKVEANGKSYTMSMDKKLKKKAEKKDEKDEYDVKYFINGQEREELAFKRTYQSIIGINIDAEIDSEAKENPEVKITYTLNGGDKVNVNFTPYKNDFYAAHVNGKCYFVTSKPYLTDMLSMLEKLQKNELKVN